MPALIKELTLYFLRLGATGFGGPIALAAYMERDLVEKKRWFSREEYSTGLALANLMPGPMATQLAIYLGYLKGKITGATLAAVAFTLPAFCFVVALGYLYLHFRGLSWLQSASYGVNAAVVAIVAKYAWILSRKMIKERFLWALFFLMALSTAITGRESLVLFALCGIAALWKRKRISGGGALAAFAAAASSPPVSVPPVFSNLFPFFFKAGATIFGTGLVIVPFLYGGMVEQNGWLTDQQFLDSVAVAMITPGPVVIAGAFMGFLAAGLPGAFAGALGLFLPVYLFVVVPAGYARKLIQNPSAVAFVEGMTAGALGALAGAALMLAQRAVVDFSSAIIAALSFFILTRSKIPEPAVILAAALAGFIAA